VEPVVTQKALGFVVRFFEGRGASIKNSRLGDEQHTL
jgi:hypothetical protein